MGNTAFTVLCIHQMEDAMFYCYPLITGWLHIQIVLPCCHTFLVTFSFISFMQCKGFCLLISIMPPKWLKNLSEGINITFRKISAIGSLSSVEVETSFPQNSGT